MPLHAILAVALSLLVVPPLNSQTDPPAKESWTFSTPQQQTIREANRESERKTIEENIQCTYTGKAVWGSTLSRDSFLGTWQYTGLIPHLPEVSCQSQPLVIEDRAIHYDDIGGGKIYHIRLHLRINAGRVIGRYDIGGLTVPCYAGFRGGMHRAQMLYGDVDVHRCFILGNQFYDAEAELEKVIDDAVVCRVVFLDEPGLKGEYRSTWFNYESDHCNDIFRVGSKRQYCGDMYWHPHNVAFRPYCNDWKRS